MASAREGSRPARLSRGQRPAARGSESGGQTRAAGQSRPQKRGLPWFQRKPPETQSRQEFAVQQLPGRQHSWNSHVTLQEPVRLDLGCSEENSSHGEHRHRSALNGSLKLDSSGQKNSTILRTLSERSSPRCRCATKAHCRGEWAAKGSAAASKFESRIWACSLGNEKRTEVPARPVVRIVPDVKRKSMVHRRLKLIFVRQSAFGSK